MHRFAPLFLFLALTSTLLAAPVNLDSARTAGTHYLQSKGIIKSTDTLTLYAIYGEDDADCIYVFNFGQQGFVLVSADDRCTPILGYSTNGCFDIDKLPANMLQWLMNYRDEIVSGIRANAPHNARFAKQWKELTDGSYQGSKDGDSHLLTSTWEQGEGYNQYCPRMNGSHVVVGCVATAMAQIIRYYGYPTRGFGKKSYVHEAYGIQAVDFDTTNYDYSLMPDHVSRRSPEEVKDMVSRLCYHCGVVVNMEYEHAGHTSGSGASTKKVVEGIRHFGYTDAVDNVRIDMNNDSLWEAIIHTEIDNRRPIEYSGFGDGGGHAFVLDGYNSHGEYHFNWGWGGYCDGFYTLTTMVGFTTNHEMITHITPSGWDGHLERFYVSPDGNGNGTSWAEANNNIKAAAKLNDLVNRDIWIKEGTYYGDEEAEFAFNLNTSANIFGGFAGTESALNQRTPSEHPTIFDGHNSHGILKLTYHGSSSRTMKLNDITFQNGYSEYGNIIQINGSNINANSIVVRHCQSDSGTVISLNDCRIRYARIEGNKAATICNLDDATLRQSLVCNNEGDVLAPHGTARIVNSTIVSNKGRGVIFDNQRNTFINNIVWDNDTNMVFRTMPSDTSLRSNAFICDSMMGDSTNILLAAANDEAAGPRFNHPSATRGVDGLSNDNDWSLARGSVCIDAGERLSESVIDGDINLTIRCRNGHIDLGCYESNYPEGIAENTSAAFVLYPNPANTAIVIDGGSQRGKCLIYDMAGRLQLQADYSGAATAINVSQLQRGAYLISLSTNQGTTHKKLIIE